jgi:hypothetical protein
VPYAAAAGAIAETHLLLQVPKRCNCALLLLLPAAVHTLPSASLTSNVANSQDRAGKLQHSTARHSTEGMQRMWATSVA